MSKEVSDCYGMVDLTHHFRIIIHLVNVAVNESNGNKGVDILASDFSTQLNLNVEDGQ